MILKILLRILFITFVVGFVVNAYSVAYGEMADYPYMVLYALVSAVIAGLFVYFEWRLQRSIVRELVAVIFGMAGGLAVTALLAMIAIVFLVPSIALGEIEAGRVVTLAGALVLTLEQIQPWIPLVLVLCMYSGITIVLQTRDDFRFLIPYIDFSRRGTREGGMLLDSSALIDGRIADILDTKLVNSPIIITDYVIRELQALADSRDGMKRERGRRGLDIVRRLQKMDTPRVTVHQTIGTIDRPVDEELVRTAKELHARLVTTDFNLNKVGQIEGLAIVNVNDIAAAVKPVVLPGQTMKLKLVRAGQAEGQAVGYLGDGTMVVVEKSADKIGETVEIEVTGSIQTSAGRMIFACPPGMPESEKRSRRASASGRFTSGGEEQ